MNPNRDRYRIALPLDLIEPIAKHILAEDVVDYISFRAVCRDWRSRTASPRSFATQFHPRRWIMLPNFGNNPSSHICFLNLHTGRSLVLNRFPELESQSIISVCDGLLVLLNKESWTIRIFNPFTRNMLDDFPPLISDFSWFPVETLGNHELELKHCPFMIDGNFPCPTFKFYTPCGSILFAKPGDRTWQFKIFKLRQVMINTFFKGTFYYINSDSIICALDLGQMVVRSLIHLHYDARVYSSVLVNFNSNLLLVRRIDDLVPRNFEIFKVDLESNIFVNFDNLGEYALFIGVNRQTIIVSSKSFPSIKRNSIYCFYLYSDSTLHYTAIPSHAQTAIYNLNDQSIELLSNFHDGDSLHPRTLADYLFKYCSIPQW